MANGGKVILVASLVTAIWGLLASAVGAWRVDGRLISSGRRALHSTALLLVSATLLLLFALITKDFTIGYVANYTSLSTPTVFAFTSLWAGMEGSLLFWTLITVLYASAAVYLQRTKRPDLVPIATAILCGLIAFFVGMLVIAANPFAEASPVPIDGAGLNPLLQSPFMTIHPVLLYLGLNGFAIPFAFAAAALITGRLDTRWITSTRRWTTLSWGLLTSGIILGGAWAYSELGWGGYWAWDPVENASLMPWLTATAFLHSVLIQERRGMLKIWNVVLVLFTYCLAIFGTFLTRSGLLNSVHTFAESPVGPAFLPLLTVMLVGAFGLIAWRYNKLVGERHLDSVLSREAMFLFNNLIFVAIAFTVFWGTIYPILAEAFGGTRVAVGPPFFLSVVLPVGLVLLALTGVGPLVAWRRASIEGLRKIVLIPLAVAGATMLGLLAAGLEPGVSLLAFGIAGFVAAAVAGEFIRGARAHHRTEQIGWLSSLTRLVSRNRRRYGGYIVHIGIVLMFIGFAGSGLRQSWKGTVSPGETFTISDYSVTYRDFQRTRTDERMIVSTTMEVRKGGRLVGTLHPQRNFHIAQQQLQSEVGIKTSLREDLYLVLTQMEPAGTATVHAWVNPLVIWIWIGGTVMLGGTFVILTYRQRVGRQLPVKPPAKKLQVRV